MHVEDVPRPNWEPLPFDGCTGVEGKLLLLSDGLLIATLRFAPHATIHEHSADFDIDVVCLDGAGYVSVGGAQSSFAAGQRVHWPPGALHRLWTDTQPMVTLMVEHH